MELVAPAGNPEKLKAAIRYGADSVYIGLDGLSLRSRSDNFRREDALDLDLGGRALYCAMNIVFRQRDLERLEKALEDLAAFPIRAFIVSDPGILPFLRLNFPKAEFHLSTQAACSNPQAAKFWRDQGFSRIIPSRELGLKEIEAMKRAVPEVAIEVFAHGAMCVAYSGRCLLSAALAGRSANSGSCAHSCRWEYRLIEEEKRRGEPLALMEGEGFSLLLSSKDLCMVSHLAELRDCGADAIKIEGRMKSTYYVAAVTRAYRTALDALSGQGRPPEPAFIRELEMVSHRPYSSGFYFQEGQLVEPGSGNYQGEALFLALVRQRLEDGSYLLDVKNSFAVGDELCLMGPDFTQEPVSGFRLLDAEGGVLERAVNQTPCRLVCDRPLEPFDIVLKRARPR
jgi:putative protease